MRQLIFLGIVCACFISTTFSEEHPPGKQVAQELKTADGKSISYLLYLPNDYDTKEGRWPLVLFLHGRGESQGPLEAVKKWGLPRLIEHGVNFHYIIASPQCPPAPESWGKTNQQALLVALLDHLSQTLKVDEDRVYLTGLSMGGFGSWRLAADHPERFAAVVPICGGGDPKDADKLKGLPIWAWHGMADPAVPVKRSIEMVEAIKKAGGTNARLTTLEGIGHVSWEAAYASPDLYEWLDKQSASKNREQAKQ